MKKKIVGILLILFIFVTAVGCGSSKSDKNNENGDSKKLTESQIKEQVIVNKNDVKITAKSLNYTEKAGVALELEIENKSSKDIIVEDTNFSVNGLMFHGALYKEVKAGEKINTSMYLFYESLSESKVYGIKDIELSIGVSDSVSLSELFTEDDIKIETDIKKYTQEYNTEGTLAINQNDIKAYVFKQEDTSTFLGEEIIVYIENNSTKNISVESEDVMINGIKVDTMIYYNIPVGKKVYIPVVLFSSDLEGKDIEKINEMQFNLKAYNYDTWDEIFKIDNLKVNF